MPRERESTFSWSPACGDLGAENWSLVYKQHPTELCTLTSSICRTNMRLLDNKTQELKFFTESDAPFGAKRPRYAVLSHTWESDEVLFVDIVSQGQGWRQKAGAEKVLGSCQLAEKEGYGYIWIDTCCTDKSSSAELSEGEFCLPCVRKKYLLMTPQQ